MKDVREDEKLKNTASAADTGSMADVDEIMKKYDRESNVRPWEGVPAIVIKFLLAGFSLFMIYMNLFAVWDERIRRPLFLGLVIIFVFILFPARKSGGKPQKVNRIPIYDIILAAAGSGSFFYFVANNKSIINRAVRINQKEVWLGVIGILILAECCRRVTGIPILVVAGCFVIYSFAVGKSLRIIIYNLFYTTNGVIGTPIGVCSTYIVLFIIFGAFLETTGIADFFIQCANCIAGAASGGPAKVAVISSALCGRGHLVRPLRHGFRIQRRQYGYHRFRHDPDDEEDRLSRRIRGRGRGSCLYRRPDHASHYGRRCLPDGGDGRRTILEYRRPGHPSGCPLFYRYFPHGSSACEAPGP